MKKNYNFLLFVVIAMTITLAGCQGGQNREPDISENAIAELNQIISNKDDKIAELEQRIGHLEAAYDRSSPKSVAGSWGKAMSTRNGALLYALYSDDSEEKVQHDLSNSNTGTGWHMGGSSPHFTGYIVSTAAINPDETVTVEVILRSELSGAAPRDDTFNLILSNTNGDWYIISET